MLWFDLDNSPHVPLFRPILAELDRRGIEYIVTGRDHAQTVDLLRLWKIPHTVVGTHAGKSSTKKVINLIGRARQLAGTVRGLPVRLAVSHGSRTQVVASWYRRFPSVVMLDYEYTEHRIFNNLGTWLLMPAMIPADRLRDAGFNLRKVIRYSGFKEEIYLADFVPAKQFRQQLGVDEDKTLVIVRPPSTTGNYHDERSESLFRKCVEHCSADPNAHVLIVNRTKQETDLFSSTLKKKNVRVLEGTVDGLQLLWHSDVVVSGGGTMNREAALLGVPTYSIFTGKRPYLDELLQEQGKLRFVESASDVETIPIVKRTTLGHYSATNKGIVKSVAQQLIDLKGRSAHTRGFSRG